MPLVLHIPHASITVPDHVRNQFVIGPEELDGEIVRLTDHATDRIFTSAFPDVPAVLFEVSRLVVDPERFEDDSEEPMAKRGMGVLYTHGAHGQRIRRELTRDERESLLRDYYRPHHQALTQAVQTHLHKHGRCLVLDCHSFPAKALPYELDRGAERPDFCLGTDSFHTPEPLIADVERELSRLGYSTSRNQPFKGCLVPRVYLGHDKRVRALMIEVNRRLYMNDDSSLSEEGLGRLITALGRLRRTLTC